MKNKLLLSLLGLTLLSGAAKAQDSKAEEIFKKYRFSLFLGPTFNSLRPTANATDNYAISKVKGNVGFSFGLGADLNINERYTIYTGLGLDWRGGTISSIFVPSVAKPNPDPNYLKRADVTYRSQFLTVPIGLKMKAFEVSKIKIFAQTGFDLGITISNKGDYSVKLSNDTLASTYTTIASKVKLGKDGFAKMVPFNLGWSVGVGAEYPVTEKNAVYAALLYRNGFIDNTTPKLNKDGFKFSDGNIRSNTFAIRVGYFF